MISKRPLSMSDYTFDQQQKILHADGLKIKAIDSIPLNICKKTSILDLSNNYLTKLDNIQQFTNLEEINLKNNRLTKGSELLVLAQLRKLNKMEIQGNPFLKQPLDEEVLELIIEKQTDIDILSGQALKKIEEVQSGQLKVVFLQNYLKKLNYHDQMKKKVSNNSNSNREVYNRPQNLSEKSNSEVFQKIMPQLYSAIQDPRIATRIKKQALGLKREKTISFEEAISEKKRRQKAQVDNLIADILLLVQQKGESKQKSSQEHQNSQYSFQESGRASPSSFIVSRSNTQNLVKTNNLQTKSPKRRYTVQNGPSSELERRKFDFNKYKHKKTQKSGFQIKEQKSQSSEINNQNSLQQKQQISVQKKMKNVLEFQQNFDSTMKNEIVQTDSIRGISMVHEDTKKYDNVDENSNFDSENFYSFNKTLMLSNKNKSSTMRYPRQIKNNLGQSRKNKTGGGEQFKIYLRQYRKSSSPDKIASQIKGAKQEYRDIEDNILIQDGFLDDTDRKLKNNREFLMSQRENKKSSPSKNYGSPSKIMPQVPESTDRYHYTNNSNISLSLGNTYEMYEQIYYQNLIKYNPTFTLLFSQLDSLEPEQKSVLIEALFKDHKQKTIQWYKEQEKQKYLKKQLRNTQIQHENDKNELLLKLQETLEAAQLKKSYLIQSQRENMRLNELIHIISKDLDQFKDKNWQMREADLQKEQQIKLLKTQLLQKQRQVQYYIQCDQVAEKTKDLQAARLRKQYLSLIKSKAAQLQQVRSWKKNQEKKKSQELLRKYWNLFKQQSLKMIVVKMKFEENSKKIIQNCFYTWVQSTRHGKMIEKNATKLMNSLKKSQFRSLSLMLKNNSNNKKEKRLKIFWADQQLIKTYFYRLQKRSKNQQNSYQIKENLANSHNNKRLWILFFQLLAKNVQINKINQLKLQKMLENQKKIKILKKLNKQYRQLSLMRQNDYRNYSLAKVIAMKRNFDQKKQFFTHFCYQKFQQQKKIYKIEKKIKRKWLLDLINMINCGKALKKKKQLLKVIIFRQKLFQFMKKSKQSSKKQKNFSKLLKNLRKSKLLHELWQQNKYFVAERALDKGRIREFFYNLCQNSFKKKIKRCQIEKQKDLQQAKIIIEKLKMVQQMQKNALQEQFRLQKKLQEEQWINKEAQYRNELIFIENIKKQQQNEAKILFNELEGLRERQKLYKKQKILFEEQLGMCQQEREELRITKLALQENLSNTSSKYERMLQMYSRAMAELQRKEKQQLDLVIREREKQKERQRTLQKKTTYNNNLSPPPMYYNRPLTPSHSSSSVAHHEFTSLRNRQMDK